MGDAVANYDTALDALNANIFEGQVGDDDSTGLEILNPLTPLRSLVREEAQRRAGRGEDVNAEILVERFIEAGLADRDENGEEMHD